MKRLAFFFAFAFALFSAPALAAYSTAGIDYVANGKAQGRVHVHSGKDLVGVVTIFVPADVKPCAVGSISVYEHDDGTPGVASYPHNNVAIKLTTDKTQIPTNYGFSEKTIYVQIAGNCKPARPGTVVPQVLVPGKAYYVMIARRAGTGANQNVIFSYGVELRNPQ